MLPKIRSFKSDAKRFIKEKIFRRRPKNRLLPDIHDKDLVQTDFVTYKKFELDETKYKSFCIYFVDLAGKLIICDGVPDKQELEALNEVFNVQDKKILQLLQESYKGNQSLELTLKQLNKFFGDSKQLYKKMIYYLTKIAIADKPLNNQEAWFIKRLSENLQLDDSTLLTSLRSLLIPSSRDPYVFLDVGRNIPLYSLNKHYRQIASACHPDKFVAYEYAEEYVLILKEKFNLINKAYNLIKDEIQ